MGKKLIFLVFSVLVFGLVTGVAKAAALNQDPGPDGIVSVEAEHFDDNVEVGGHTWEETGPTGGFTGVTGMWAPKGRGGHQSNYAANSERLDYEINFVKTGTYYPWILGWAADGNSDTCHIGLDGQEIATADQMVGWDLNYSWSNDTRPASGHDRGSFEVTSTGIHVLNIWVREDGLIIDKIVLTTNPDYTLTGTEPGPPESPRGARAVAFSPNPTDGATDVPRDVVLNWTPGEFAPAVNGHRVFLGEVFSDVNDGLGGITHSASDYAPPQRLDFETTYYWRVDEVNAPPDSTVYKGDVWSFTTEPIGYAIENLTATASSAGQADFGPEKTIDGSGLDADGLHSTGATDMWLSGNEPLGAWIQYEFDNAYKLHEMWVWNSNQIFEGLFGFGMKDVTVEYSINGTEWTALADAREFAQAPGTDGYAHNTTVDFGGAVAQYVRL
ncbi:MAG: discoidin domain-containing protein, partial [Planctomycetota bacterium]